MARKCETFSAGRKTVTIFLRQLVLTNPAMQHAWSSGCHTLKTRVRTLIFLFLVGAIWVACDKEKQDNDSRLIPLTITATDSPESISKGETIVSNIRCSGTDLCYKFEKFEITGKASRVFEVRAKATYPQQPVACPQAIYNIDTTLAIPTTSSGQYVIRFYNENDLFKTDTVIVN